LTLPRVVVVGAGFAGLQAAKALAETPVQVTLVDRRNHHLFQPLLYQVATAALDPSEIAAPIRRIFRGQHNVEVLLGNVHAVDPGSKKVVMADGELSYDYLILATGAGHSYFGHDEWAPFAPGLKSLEDAFCFRRKILLSFEAAERDHDPQDLKRLLTFVIVGGGPTGVELAGAMAEISMRSMTADFRKIDPKSARVILLEGAERILPTFPEDLSEKAAAQLAKLGVEVRTGAQVTLVDEEGVKIGDEQIASLNVFWAAGVSASPLGQTLDVELDHAGRVAVEPDLSVPGHPEIFVVGDLASLKSQGRPVPGVAPAAMQEGNHAAGNIIRALERRPSEPFRYIDKGTLATIGRAAAVADMRGVHLSGFVAWIAWLAIHIWYLIGFRNRAVVMLDWARAYLGNERQVRLIPDEVDRVLPELSKPH
jgi:NADH:ubiquinone reductase (H+-translocating)